MASEKKGAIQLHDFGRRDGDKYGLTLLDRREIYCGEIKGKAKMCVCVYIYTYKGHTPSQFG